MVTKKKIISKFVSVIVDCPKCGHCKKVMTDLDADIITCFDLDSAPSYVILDIKSKMPFRCTSCSTEFNIKSRMIPNRYTVEA